MIQAFIKIRFFQIYRAIKGLGIIRSCLLLGLFVFVAFILFIQSSKYPNSLYVAGIYLLILILIQFKRSDKQFLKVHFNNFKRILLIEYMLLIIPLFICFIYNKQWQPLLLSVILLFVIVNINFRFKSLSLNTLIQRLIPSSCFEWKSGIRKNLLLIVPLFVLGLGTSFYIGSVPIVIFILGIIPFGFYEKGESLQMLLASEMGASGFLFNKILMQLILFSILVVPLIIAFIIFHYEIWYIAVIEYIIFISTHVYIIFTKYSFYQPNVKASGTQAFGIIGAMGVLFPFFIPIVWLLSFLFYFKSKKNLNFYLNDYN